MTTTTGRAMRQDPVRSDEATKDAAALRPDEAPDA